MPTIIHPPGPKGKLVLGSLPELQRDPINSMTEWARTYGDMVYLRLVNVDAYLLSHPDLVEEVLVTLNRNFIKHRLLRDAGEVLGNGLLTSEGEFWLRQRRLMAPAFHRERIASYGDTMVEHTEAMLRAWRDGGVYDIHDAMMHLTLGIVAKTLFGAEVGDRAADVGAALEIALRRFVERMSLLRLLDRLPLPRNRRFKRAMETLDAIIYDVIEQRRRSGLVAPPRILSMAKIVALAVAGVGVVMICNVNRAAIGTLAGVPWAIFIVLGVLGAYTFLLQRTRFGRYIYAIGGNAEAARRAGINVSAIRTWAFVLCSFTAGIGGLLYASYLGGMSNNVNGGQLVLYAVAAAVIGGTSLFGGRGKAAHGVLGGLVIGGIYNGMYLLGLTVQWEFIVTGGVLLFAVAVDALSRRGSAPGVDSHA